MPRISDSMPPVSRRHFLERAQRIVLGSAAGVLGLATARGTRADAAAPGAQTGVPPKLTKELLETSPYAYVSPLLRDGRESRCHGEVWYGWIDGAVVCTVAADRWKARALDRGLDRARIWVGDHGRWKTLLGGRNEAFRKAPHFDAKASRIGDPVEVEALLAVYEVKYPNEIASWRDRMRRGVADGSRILIRYAPQATSI